MNQHFILDRGPKTDDELYELVWTLWGVRIPRTPVCPNHSTPFAAFADAYFGRSPVVVWKASRGMGGKSRTLAYLTLTESVILGIDVNILGGSGAQSLNIHDAMREGWDHPIAPTHMRMNDNMYETRLSNGSKVKALMASQRSVRGPHPVRLRMDEIDEMDVAILDSALGQPMPAKDKPNIDTQVVLSSTHQYPDKTMSEMLLRAAQDGWPVHQWCFKETSNPVDGWLSQEFITRTKQTVTKRMWEVEYDLQEPSFGSRAFDTDCVETMFEGYGEDTEPGRQTYKNHSPLKGEQYEFEEPDTRHGEYITGADWAKEKDWTVIATFRVDCDPWRLVAYSRTNRKPYPLMVKLMNDRLKRFPGHGIHDATGLGNVIGDYVDQRVTPFIMSGRARDDMLTEYVNAVEKGQVVAPRIESAFLEHKYCSLEDLYGRGKDVHLPDTVCAFALCWNKRNRRTKGARPVIDVSYEEGSPWKAVG